LAVRGVVVVVVEVVVVDVVVETGTRTVVGAASSDEQEAKNTQALAINTRKRRLCRVGAIGNGQ